jgi:SAM-dependent methyltransferase
VFNPPDYSAPENFLSPRLGPWTIDLYLHRKPILDAVKEAEPVLSGRLLDVGCGRKPYASILHCDEHIGVDVENSPHRPEQMVTIYDGLTIPFSDCEFDSILCTEVLEHCKDPQRIVREMWRVLRPGGYALITAPMVIHHHEEPWDYQRFTRYGMEWMAMQAKFHVAWIKSRGGIYTTALVGLYGALGHTVSRRPFSDFLLWCMWPVSCVILRFERWKNRPVVISLGWQMLVRK